MKEEQTQMPILESMSMEFSMQRAEYTSRTFLVIRSNYTPIEYLEFIREREKNLS